MGFIKFNSTNRFRLAELYNSPKDGIYVRKEKGQFSALYILKNKEHKEIGIFGNKSLDQEMSDELLGKHIQIKCKKLVQTGQVHPFAVAEVLVWDDSSSEETYSMEEYKKQIMGADYQIPERMIFVNPSPSLEDEEVPEYALTIPDED